MPTPEEIAVDPRMERVTAAILSSAPRFTAADVYDGLARLAGLAAAARTEFMRTDFLIVPSALHHYLVSGARLAACSCSRLPLCSPLASAAHAAASTQSSKMSSATSFMHGNCTKRASCGLGRAISMHAGGPRAEIVAEEGGGAELSWAKNAKLGRFTNFVNLLDLAAVAVPSGVLHCRPSPAATGARPLQVAGRGVDPLVGLGLQT